MRSLRVFGFGIALALTIAFAATPARAADIYDAAIAHAGRSPTDLKRDLTDKPATVLRFAGIKPGMRVADFLGYEGYYSELLSYVVGPRGHVLLLNNKAYDGFANDSWRARIGNGRLPNVEHRTIDLAHMASRRIRWTRWSWSRSTTTSTGYRRRTAGRRSTSPRCWTNSGAH